jgi:hypothetical protein
MEKRLKMGTVFATEKELGDSDGQLTNCERRVGSVRRTGRQVVYLLTS